MNPRVYEFVYHGPAETLVDIYGAVTWLRSSEAALLAAIAGAVLVLAMLNRQAPRPESAVRRAVPLLVASVSLFATYCLTWRHVDEVAINLEHAYNLLHFGRFSFAPQRMVDGTVEYVYYLLLTPFAWSPRALVTANFALGWTIAWAHLWLLAQFLKAHPPAVRLGLLLLFSVNYPLVAVLANGFGNGLVSLAFLAAIYLHLQSRTRGAVILASLLPLLRPDAVLYSLALLYAFDPAFWRWDWRKLWRWTWPIGALVLYLVGHRIAYGHWIPTPIAFKSVYPGMVSPGSLQALLVYVMTSVAQPTQIAGLLAMVAAFVVTDNIRLRLVGRLLLPMTAVLFFYSLTRSVLGDLSGDTYARYWVGFGLTLFLALFFGLAHLASALGSNAGGRLLLGRLMAAAVILLALSAVLWDGARTVRNRGYLGVAGQIVNRVMPPGLSLATSELNAFGLMVTDREVIDLWGYTNPAIAQSRLLNGTRVRTNPELFLSLKPDVFFAYEQLTNPAGAEEYLATFEAFGRPNNLLGDMTRVLDEYDLVLVRHPQRSVVLLVRRAVGGTFREAILQQGYQPATSRDIDRPAFERIYARRPLMQFRF